MSNVQQTNIRAYTDVLQPAPPSTSLPNIDTDRITWVWPASPEFLGAEWFAWRVDSADINGNVVTIDDVGGAGNTDPTYDRGQDRGVLFGRYYQSINIILSGGTVSPIVIGLRIRVIGADGVVRGYEFANESTVNPNEVNIGPIWVPPGFGAVRITNVAVGGAGDTMSVRAIGQAVPAGMPPAILPGPITAEGT